MGMALASGVLGFQHCIFLLFFHRYCIDHQLADAYRPASDPEMINLVSSIGCYWSLDMKVMGGNETGILASKIAGVNWVRE